MSLKLRQTGLTPGLAWRQKCAAPALPRSDQSVPPWPTTPTPLTDWDDATASNLIDQLPPSAIPSSLSRPIGCGEALAKGQDHAAQSGAGHRAELAGLTGERCAPPALEVIPKSIALPHCFLMASFRSRFVSRAECVEARLSVTLVAAAISAIAETASPFRSFVWPVVCRSPLAPPIATLGRLPEGGRDRQTDRGHDASVSLDYLPIHVRRLQANMPAANPTQVVEPTPTFNVVRVRGVSPTCMWTVKAPLRRGFPLLWEARDYGATTWSPACHEQLSWRFHWWRHSHSVPVQWQRGVVAALAVEQVEQAAQPEPQATQAAREAVRAATALLNRPAAT